MAPVIFFMLDGVRPDALALAHCPNIQALIDRGTSTLQASSVMPCLTLPCHTSIFYSMLPIRHGILTNDWRPFAYPLPGLVDLIHRAHLKTASFYNWEPLRDLSRPGTLSFSYFRDNSTVPHGDQVIADEAARFIASERPDFAFVYFGTVDMAGHAFAWMSDAYLRQLERVDDALGTVLSVLPNDHIAVLQSDHGGHAHQHDSYMPEDMTIPWIMAGTHIRRGYVIERDVSLLDTAPTIAQVLGLPIPANWEGLCLDEIFEYRSVESIGAGAA
jgi:predicted AlkP superfamily pyrophosphatase or phosphodiesterase